MRSSSSAYRSRLSTLWPPLLCGALLFLIVVTVFPPDLSTVSSICDLSPIPSTPSLQQLPPHPCLDNLFPSLHKYDLRSSQDINARTMNRLMGCMKADSCRENQTNVVLLGSPHFHRTLEGALAGENVWVQSILDALDSLGYSYLFSADLRETVTHYRTLPSLVPLVILEPESVAACFSDPTCLKSASNPGGIPFWKLIGFHWWLGASSHPLGERWTVSPERWPDPCETFYLGYSVERACRSRRGKGAHVPPHERPNQAYVLAKRMSYFEMDTYPWDDDAFAIAAHEHGISFVMGTINDTKTPGFELPPGTTNMGRLNQTAFLSSIAHSRVMIGIGQPYLSPSPWDALCMGVPFINPAHNYDKAAPDDRSKWVTQHDPMMRLGEPWAYTVRKGDGEGFVQAVGKALRNPIDSFVHPDMTIMAMRDRTAYFLSYDWHGLGKELLANRTKAGDETYEL